MRQLKKGLIYKMIPFSPPRIDQKIIDEVIATLKSGWITTGPRTKQFERNLAEYCGVSNVICLNSATSGLEIMLRWFGVREGDEIILPAYTYSATANVVMHCGAKPVMVDSGKDFNIDPAQILRAITPKTKVIMPVDIGGLPCDYNAIYKIVNSPEIKKMFRPASNDLMLPMLMILPRPRGAMYGNACWLRSNMALTCSSICCRHASSGKTSGGHRRPSPALLTRMSSRPAIATALSIKPRR